MIDPPPLRRISGMTRRLVRYIDFTLTSMTSSQVASSVSSTVP